ncbi:hypothetical protein BJ138DRAFT_1129034 [Hygrophoropsis aurantiaca]|uniref:Uncharacterized protein n=1 Tax=Hygrophoropsis aurantiaca TaxID=72124 RepID=A0ACB8A3P2_9AGAM|nr:hypothetical protein BJ138DRAFT_1129034 [Hygrophoropsis aurantiaca]
MASAGFLPSPTAKAGPAQPAAEENDAVALMLAASEESDLIVEINEDSSSAHTSHNSNNATPSFQNSPPTIPQRNYLPRNALAPVVYAPRSSVLFRTTSHEGFPLDLALEQSFNSLRDRYLLVLEDVASSKSATLRIEWPGYMPWQCRFDVRRWKGTREDPLMRHELAHKLASMIHTFFQICKVDEQSSAEDVIWRLGGQLAA